MSLSFVSIAEIAQDGFFAEHDAVLASESLLCRFAMQTNGRRTTDTAGRFDWWCWHYRTVVSGQQHNVNQLERTRAGHHESINFFSSAAICRRVSRRRSSDNRGSPSSRKLVASRACSAAIWRITSPRCNRGTSESSDIGGALPVVAEVKAANAHGVRARVGSQFHLWALCFDKRASEFALPPRSSARTPAVKSYKSVRFGRVQARRDKYPGPATLIKQARGFASRHCCRALEKLRGFHNAKSPGLSETGALVPPGSSTI